MLAAIEMNERTPNSDAPAINVLALAEEADRAWFRDELAFAWRVAEDEAAAAYRAWCAAPGAAGYAVYRAAQDRADQAQDTMAAKAPRQRG
jgi:hypothetical protein